MVATALPDEVRFPAATLIVPIDAGVVRLPASADISTPRADGTSVEFVQPDGTVIIIPGGAVSGFVLFVGEVEIPDETLVALLESDSIETAAGPSAAHDGAHGSFEAPGPQTVGQGTDFETALLGDTDTPPATFPNSPLPPPSEDLSASDEPPTPVNHPATIGGDTFGAVTEDALPNLFEDFAGGTAWDWGEENAYEGYAKGTGAYLTESVQAGGLQSVSRILDIGDAGTLKLSFDLFKIDSWESEEFIVYLDDGVAFRFQPETAVGGSDGATGTFSVSGLTGTYTITSSGEDGNLFDYPTPGGDRVYHVEIVLQGADGALKLGFGNTLDEGFLDEDFGVDNIRLVSTELSASGTLTITDPDPGEAAFQPTTITGDNGYGTFELDASGRWVYRADNLDPRIQALGSGETVTDSFLAWSVDGSASQLVTVTITGTNDAPIATADTAAAFVEDAGAILVSPGLTLSDIDSPTLAGATVRIDSNFARGEDVLTFTEMPGITGRFNALTGILRFTGTASLADYEALLRSVRYENSSDTPDHDARLITFEVNDGEASSNLSSTIVSITPTNDVPVISPPAAASVTEDGALIFSGITVADPDSGTLTVKLTVTNGHLDPADTAGGATLTLTGSAANINAALAGLKYVPTANYSGPAILTIVASDGTSTETKTVDLTVTAVADAPVIAVESLITTPVPTGDAFRLNLVTDGAQNLPDVAALHGARGGFVAVWQSYNQAGDAEEIYLRRFTASAGAIGPEIHVNTTTASHQQNAQVTVLDDGRIVVTWESYDPDGTYFDIFARIYNADGTAATPEFQVSTSTAHNQQAPSVTALADGGYIFTWSSTDGTAYDIYTQRFAADGTPIGGETRVSSGTPTQAEPTVIALPDGGYAIIWTEGRAGAENTATRFRVFDEHGNGGPEIVVDDGTHPDIAVLAGGGFVVVSELYGNDGSYDGIFVRLYNAQGVAETVSFQANTSATGYQEWPTVIGLADGGFLVAWSGGAGGAVEGIFLQRFDADGNRIGDELRLSDAGSNPQLAILASGDVVVTWQGADGESWGRVLQASNAGGVEDQPLELPLTISLADPNGAQNEVLSELRLSGLPDGFTLEAGARDPSTGDWIIDRSTAAERDYLDAVAAHTRPLVVTPAEDFNGGVTVHVTATSQEPSNGSTSTTTASVSVSVSPADEPASPFVLLDTDPGIEFPAFTDESSLYVVDDLSTVDLIADYDFGAGDRIDLSTLLDGVSGEDLSDFVRYVDGTLSIDTDGTAGPADFVAAAEFITPPDHLALILDNGFEVVVASV